VVHVRRGPSDGRYHDVHLMSILRAEAQASG